MKRLVIAAATVMAIAEEYVLVDKVPSSIPKIELEKAIVISLGNRKWNVVSVDEQKIQAELNHRNYECTIDIKNVNDILILNDHCLYESDDQSESYHDLGVKDHPSQLVKVEKAIPGRWLRNLEKDMQTTVRGLTLVYK